MKIFSKRMTDSEYIETVRKSYKRRWLNFVILLSLFLPILLATIYFAFDFDKKSKAIFESMAALENPTEEQCVKNLVEASRITGVRLGFTIAGGLYCGIFGIIGAIGFVNRRRDALLLKYYDKNEIPNKIGADRGR
jgi:hypothetical protein